MKISLFTGGVAQTNGYLIQAPEGNILIDAPEGITQWIAQQCLKIDHVLLTHQHYDHVQDAAALQLHGAKLCALENYSKELTLESPARSWGLPIQVTPYTVDLHFDMTSPLKIAGIELTLAHVPGHSLDSVTFYEAALGVLFSGDTLFSGSVGRTDLPGGSSSQLLKGIAKHLMTLPESTRVFPGHGPSTTIAVELRSNPYLE